MDIKLDKKTLIQVVVVAVVLLFMLEGFAIGGGAGAQQQQDGTVVQSYIGVADVNLTVLDYRPYLYVDGVLNESMKAEVAQMEGVEEVFDESARTVVSFTESRDAPEIYSSLRRKNITTYTLATLSMPSYFQMMLDNGSTVNVVGSRFEYMTEPVSKVGGKMLMRLVIETVGEAPRGMRNMMPILSHREFEFDAEVLGSGGKTYYYTVPWEERDLDIGALEDEYGAENVEYGRNDNVLLAEALTPQEMIAKKFEYVKTISEMAISVDGNFTDRERVAADFGEDATFMDSSLKIRTDGELGLNFTHEVKYIYTVAVPEEIGGYNFYTNSYQMTASGQMNETIPATMNTTVLGETVMEIISIEER